jgi:hypothetical protein
MQLRNDRGRFLSVKKSQKLMEQFTDDFIRPVLEKKGR